MAGKIFINYRRDDDPGSTGRLFDKLELHFPRDRLFFDVDSIPPGVDFVKYLDEQVGQCDVLLAVVGKTWLDAADDGGARRLESPDDFVRIEIESALKRGIRVIPVLMNQAEMPGEERLPDSLKPFARRNAVRLNHDRFKADCDGLIASIGKALDLAEDTRKEAERRNAAQRDALDTEETSRADALASWAAIKDSTNAQDFIAHLERHPRGPTERMARERLKTLQWTAGALPEIVALSVLPFGLLVAALFMAAGWNFKIGRAHV